MTCKICSGSSILFDIVDLNKICSPDNQYLLGPSGIQVPYYRCENCKFIQSNILDKLHPREVKQLIYNDEYILIDPDYAGLRPMRLAEEISRLYPLSEFAKCRILDYGSGLGIFEKHMRAFGYRNVSSYDPFVNKELPSGTFDLIVCFEVIEHHPFPHDLIKILKAYLGANGAILISTSLQPKDIDHIRARWWYLGPRNGHISIFHENSLFMLAKEHGLSYTNSRFHYFSNSKGFAEHYLPRESHQPKVITLYAPSIKSSFFHETEIMGSAKAKWTKNKCISWPDLYLEAGLVRVKIPYLMEIKKGFLKNVHLILGDQKLDAKVTDTEIYAEFEVSTSEIYTIKLITLDPIRPNSFKSTDDSRLLGLAIQII